MIAIQITSPVQAAFVGCVLLLVGVLIYLAVHAGRKALAKVDAFNPQRTTAELLRDASDEP